jgi:cell wall-active antibiotic response 4TMS protein YvqF
MTEPNEAESPTPPNDRSRWGGRRDRGVDKIALVWGAILLAVGLWFFLKETLGIELPAIDWGDIWPVIIIVVGAVLIIQAMRRRTG